MKKFLSIKNSQGIYVARASFSSNETVIDFANNNANSSIQNQEPVSIVVTPDQPLANLSVVCEPNVCESTKETKGISQIGTGYQSDSNLSLVSKTSSKKKRFSKVLRVLRLKSKTKMAEHVDDSGKSNESPTSGSSTQSISKIGKGRAKTAALVKKFSLTTKKSSPKLQNEKKSSIPLRTSTSFETIANKKKHSHSNLELVTSATVETISTATTTTYSSSEMNLVNIDYRQENDDLNIGQMHQRSKYSSNRSSGFDGGDGNGNMSRSSNTNSYLSSTVDKNKIGNVRGSIDKLQITISGKKRNSAELLSDLQHKQQQQPMEKSEQKKLERKTLTMQPNKLNISHDLTLMNTIGIPTASKTQIPSMPSSYRITTGSIKKVKQSGADIKTQSTMQSQQTVDVSASSVAVEHKSNAPTIPSEPMTSASALVTSFDAEDSDDIAAILSKEKEEIEKKTSLLTEINEAERRNSMTNLSERGRRFPGIAASETIKFSHKSNEQAIAVSEESRDAQASPIPKLVIDGLSLPSDTDNQFDQSDNKTESVTDNQSELYQTLSSSTGAKLLQESNNDELTVDTQATPPSPSLQFEVGKQVRPIFTSNQNLHHIGFATLEHEFTPTNELSSIISATSSFTQNNNNKNINNNNNNKSNPPALDTHNQSYANGSSAFAGNEKIKNDTKFVASNREQPRSLNRSRRRIAYLESTSDNIVAGSPSTSNSTINTEDDDILGENRLDSTLTQLTNLNTSSTFISDFFMPPYGDLVWREDGRLNMSSTPEKREHLYKILVIGELGTGKTSFIKRYVHQFFSQNYRATIGVDFALKVLNWDQNTIIRLQLWDIAGQERFGNMTRVYYKEAVGAFIVFDVTRNATFDAVIKWKQDLDSKVQLANGSPIPCILIANKCDQAKQGIVNTPSKMDDYVKEHGFAGWFETSAKENINIEEAAKALVNKILLNDKIINAGEILDSDKFNLDGQSDRPKKNCSC